MRTSFAVGLVALLVASAAIAGYAVLPRLQPGNQRSSTTGNSTHAVTTLEQLIAGQFPSASDKSGMGGVLVSVVNLTVLYVHDEPDGDWHVAVTDGSVSAFITEITPAYQQALGRPVAGMVIDETGIPFCDTAHQAESWHGNTCWEIHPVIAWHLAG